MISDNDINDIVKVFPIKFEGRSRIDNYPFFIFKNNDLEITDINYCFETSLIDIEYDDMDDRILVIKITDIKPDFYKYLRKEKLIKLNIII
jgi:hypothetical protein